MLLCYFRFISFLLFFVVKGVEGECCFPVSHFLSFFGCGGEVKVFTLLGYLKECMEEWSAAERRVMLGRLQWTKQGAGRLTIGPRSSVAVPDSYFGFLKGRRRTWERGKGK